VGVVGAVGCGVIESMAAREPSPIAPQLAAAAITRRHPLPSRPLAPLLNLIATAGPCTTPAPSPMAASLTPPATATRWVQLPACPGAAAAAAPPAACWLLAWTTHSCLAVLDHTAVANPPSRNLPPFPALQPFVFNIGMGQVIKAWDEGE
jgi:hypothetical protein